MPLRVYYCLKCPCLTYKKEFEGALEIKNDTYNIKI